MTDSATLCPGIGTVLGKDGRPIIHYLKRINESTGNLLCDQLGCKFDYRDRDGKDTWQSGYVPEIAKKDEKSN
jgi:hypothetical protein